MSDSKTREERRSRTSRPTTTDSTFNAWMAEVWDDAVEPIYAKHHWELMQSYVDMPPKPQVLVAGCATGAIIPELLRMMEPPNQGRVISLEERNPMLAKARERVEAYDPRRVFLRGDSIQKLKFAAGVFDLVLSSLAWVDLPEPGVALREFHRVLVPGGQVALGVSLRGTLQEVYDLFGEVTLKYDLPEVYSQLEEQMHRRHPEAEDCRILLEGLGFEDVTVHTKELEITFPAGQDFFSTPAIEALYVRHWKKVAGDHGRNLIRYTREAINTYFGTDSFPVTLNVGAIFGTKTPPELITVF